MKVGLQAPEPPNPKSLVIGSSGRPSEHVIVGIDLGKANHDWALHFAIKVQRETR